MNIKQQKTNMQLLTVWYNAVEPIETGHSSYVQMFNYCTMQIAKHSLSALSPAVAEVGDTKFAWLSTELWQCVSSRNFVYLNFISVLECSISWNKHLLVMDYLLICYLVVWICYCKHKLIVNLRWSSERTHSDPLSCRHYMVLYLLCIYKYEMCVS
jgi:hypothetical protein